MKAVKNRLNVEAEKKRAAWFNDAGGNRASEKRDRKHDNKG